MHTGGVLMARTWSRWLPAAVVPAVIAGSVALASQAGAEDLPDRSPQDVLLMISERTVDAYSGAFEQTSDLGLPELPGDMSVPSDDGAGADAAAVSAALELLTGEHSGRVFVDGPGTARLQVMDSFSERDVIVDDGEVWLYDSADNAATHVTLPPGGGHGHGMKGQPPTPEDVADRVVAMVELSTELTVADDVLVAGRAAYELVLTPRTEATLVGSVAIAVDGQTGLPLRVSVHARDGGGPAFEVAYTSLEVGSPDAALFDFTPPPGATVEEVTVPEHDPRGPHPRGDRPQVPEPTVVGTGWETVLIAAADLGPVPLLEELTVAVDGGRLLSTALLNVLITDDGRVVVGSVPLERLQAAASAS